MIVIVHIQEGVIRMKDREIVCEHYVNEGSCLLGKKGTFRKHCQKCQSYIPVKGKDPARKDNRREKFQRRKLKEMRES